MSTTEISAEGRSTDGQPDPATSHALTKEAPAGDSTILTSGESQQEPKQESPTFQRDFKFWVVIVALCGVMVMASLENTVVVTAGPVIVADLMMGDTYIWISNAFFVTSAAVQPLFGQICDVFGRRWPMLFATSLFILGSGICGGATNGSVMIAGRAIQGSGSGGAVMLAHIILADIVPLRQRGYYLAILLSIFGIGLAVGPIVGGAFVDHATWRWAFYVNLPFGGLTLVLLYLFLHVNYDRGTTVLQKLRRIDWLGNALIMAGTVSMLYALTGAGVLHPWSSWETLVPLLLGLLGLLLFAAWETYGQRLAADLVMPPHLFHHRTSWTVAVGTFFHWMLVYWSLYFVPVYFQAVLLYSAQYTGVAILPLTLVSIVGSILAAMAVSRWGRFKLIHIVGETVFAVGMGLFGLMGRTTTVAEWVLLQCLSALGGGMILDTLLPAFQAPVSESDQAAATSTWTFIRTIGGVWGVAVPATIFNNRIDQLARRISDPAVAQLLMGGGGYEHATAAFVNSFDEPVRGQVLDVYRDAMRLVFLSSVAFGGAAALLFSLEKDVKLREELETDYGLRDKDKN